MKVLVPTSINDITLEQYQRFSKINTENQDEEFFIFKTIEIFCGIDMKTISKFPFKDAKSISEDIIAVLDQNVPFTDRFELEGVRYGFIPDLQAMSLGEFIDLEENLRDPQNFHIAASVMYRPVTKEYKELYAIDGYEASKKAQLDMKSAPIGIISSAVVFLQYRERVTNGFSGLFSEGGGEDTNYSREAQFAAKYGWFNSIYALTKGDATKYTTVTEMNHLEALMFLEFEKEKVEIERAQYRKNR